MFDPKQGIKMPDDLSVIINQLKNENYEIKKHNEKFVAGSSSFRR